MAEPSLGALGEALIAIRADLGGLRDDLKTAKKVSTESVKDIEKSVLTASKGIGTAMSALITVPLVALAAGAVVAGQKFDDAFDSIRQSTGATGAALDGLQGSFRAVFRDVPDDAQKVADSISLLHQRLDLAGKPLEGLTTQFLNLSRVGTTELNPLIDSSTRLFGAWGVATHLQSGLLDQLWKTSQLTGTNIGSLIKTVETGAPTFKQFGISVETAAAMVGQWTKEGLDADRMIGALRVAVINFAKEGISAEDGLRRIVVQMQALGPGAAQFSLAVQAFGRGAVAMTEAINRDAFSVDELMTRLDASRETINTTAADVAGFAERFDLLKKHVIEALEPLGTRLLDILEKKIIPVGERVVAVLGDMIRWFSDLPESVQTTTIALAGLFATMGPGILIAANLAEKLIEFKKAMVAIQGAQAVTGLLGMLSIGPGALIVAGAVALGAAIFAIKQNLDAVGSRLENPNLTQGPRLIPGAKNAAGNELIDLDQARKVAAEAGPLVQGLTLKIRGVGEAAHGSVAPITFAKEKVDELANALKAYAARAGFTGDATADYEAIIKRLGNTLFEGIAFDLARGNSTGDLAKVYRTAEGDIQAIIDVESALADQLESTTESMDDHWQRGSQGAATFAKSLEGQPDVLSNMAKATARFNQETGGLISGSLLVRHGLKGVADTGALIPPVFGKIAKSGASAFTEVNETIKSFAGSLTQLAQVSQGRFASVVQDIANVTVAWKSGAEAAAAYGEAETAAGRASALAAGAVNVVAATQNARTRNQAVMGGAASGAAAGSAFGPWGALVGGIGGAIVGFFAHGRAREDVARQAGTRFGTIFGKETIEAIVGTMEAGHSRMASELINLGRIIQDAGGLTADNISLMADRLRDTFSLVGTGELEMSEATKVLDENFGQFVEAGTSGMGVLHGRFVEMIHLSEELGIRSKAIGEFIQAQVGNVFTGIERALTPAVSATKKLAEEQKRLADLQRQIARGGDQAALRSEIEAVTKSIKEQQDILKATALTAGGGTAAAGAILAGVAELQRQGVDYVTALSQAGPAVEALRQQLEAAGIDGGAAFAQLAADVALVSNEVAGPALQAVSGFGQALVGLHNSGRLTGEMFAGLAGQIAVTRDRLVEQGQDGGAVLRALAPQLQQIWEIQKQTGMSVDATTQALLDEAEAAGLVGDAFVGPQQQMIDALNETNNILTAIAKSLGADLPAAARQGARGVTSALEMIPDETISTVIINTIDRHQTIIDPPPEPPPVEEGFDGTQGGAITTHGVQLFSRGVRVQPRRYDTSGLLTPGVQYFARTGLVRAARGTDTVPVTTPGEIILNAASQKIVAPQLQGSSAVVTVNVDASVRVDKIEGILSESDLKMTLERSMIPLINRVWDDGIAGVREETLRALRLK